MDRKKLEEERKQARLKEEEENRFLQKMADVYSRMKKNMAEQNYAEAAKDLNLLCEHGDRKAAEQLGRVYSEEGYGIKDPSLAVKYFERSDTDYAKAWMIYAHAGTEFARQDPELVLKNKNSRLLDLLSEKQREWIRNFLDFEALRNNVYAGGTKTPSEAVQYYRKAMEYAVQEKRGSAEKDLYEYIILHFKELPDETVDEALQFAEQLVRKNDPAGAWMKMNYRLAAAYPDEDLTGEIAAFRNSAGFGNDASSCKTLISRTALEMSEYEKRMKQLSDRSDLEEFPQGYTKKYYLRDDLRGADCWQLALAYNRQSKNAKYGRKELFQKSLYWLSRAGHDQYLSAMKELEGIYRDGIGWEKDPERADYWQKKNDDVEKKWKRWSERH